jgi:hypothetical protein
VASVKTERHRYVIDITKQIMSSKKKRYGSYSSAYGAAALLLTYALVRAGIVPKSDVPLITEAAGTVLGAIGGLLHARLTDSDGVQQAENQG